MKRWLLGSILVLLCLSLTRAGTVEEKYPSGKVKLKYSTDADGKKDGSFVEYYENGKTKIKAVCKADAWEGPYASFHPNGKPHVSANYKNGKLHGSYAERTDLGQLRLSATYNEGMRDATLKLFDNGQLTCTQDFKDGGPTLHRSLAQIQETLRTINTLPSTTKKVDGLAADRQAGLRRLKAYRYLVGVPWENLELDDELNKYTDAAAQICNRIGRMDHAPANPGMPEDAYQTAYKGTKSSNLYVGRKTFVSCVDGFMDDSDASNIARVGHRRWCINPAMQKTGFGMSGRFAAMYAMDKSQTAVPDFEYISYPASGFMPISYFGEKHAWNVSFNPKKFKKPEATVQVKVYRKEDSSWDKVGTPIKLNYINLDPVSRGIPYCIIFRPEQLSLSDGRGYWVEIEGLRYLDDKPVAVRFMIVFVNL